MFVLSAAFWVDGIVYIALGIANDVNGKSSETGFSVNQITLFNALILINVNHLHSSHDVYPWLTTSGVCNHGRHRRLARMGDLPRDARYFACCHCAIGIHGP
jgi:hypothetical protein